MPRQESLDARGTLYHVMGGGLIARRYAGSRKKIPKARRLFCQLAVNKMGYSGFEDLPEIENHLYVDLGVPYLSVPKTEFNA